MCALWPFFFCNPVISSHVIHYTAALLRLSSLHTGYLPHCLQLSVLDLFISPPDLTPKQNMAVNVSHFSVTDHIATTVKIHLIGAAASDHLWLSLWLDLHLVGGQRCVSAVTTSLLSPVITLFLFWPIESNVIMSWLNKHFGTLWNIMWADLHGVLISMQSISLIIWCLMAPAAHRCQRSSLHVKVWLWILIWEQCLGWHKHHGSLFTLVEPLYHSVNITTWHLSFKGNLEGAFYLVRKQ